MYTYIYIYIYPPAPCGPPGCDGQDMSYKTFDVMIIDFS